MCDSTGLLQHAVYGIPDRSHGSCIDGNARALLLCCGMAGGNQADVMKTMQPRFAAFIEHGWNPDAGRFRNVMDYDRRWLEDVGSEDSHGRALWAFGASVAQRHDPQLAQGAGALFEQALAKLKVFTSPRAWAFALLGLSLYRGARPNNHEARQLQLTLGGRLHARLLACESQDWVWFKVWLGGRWYVFDVIETGAGHHASDIARPQFAQDIQPGMAVKNQ